MNRKFKFVLGLSAVSLMFLGAGWGKADENLGITPENPISFVYQGETLRVLPDVPVTEETAVIPAEEKTARFSRGEITTRTTEQTDAAAGLKIRFERTSYSDFPQVTEWTAWFENVSDKNTPNLRDILACDITFDTGKAVLEHGIGEENDPKLNYSWGEEPLEAGKKCEFSPREAYPSYGAFPYFRLRGEKNSYIIAIGWTGGWSASFEALNDGTVRFCAGQKMTDLYLKPGENFRTPKITILRLDPDSDAVNLWRHWYREYIMPREEGKVIAPKLIYDLPNGGELYQKITEKQLIDAIRCLRSCGYPCDGLWIDAGWYLREGMESVSGVGCWFRTGDWTPDPARLPNGLKPVADELGPDAKLTLWYEPERIHEKSPAFEKYEKYTIPGLNPIESRRMDMTSPETVAFLSEMIGNSIRENGVRIYRQDSNGAGPGPFIEQLEKTDPRFNDRRGMAENAYVLGYLTFWQNLKAMNPGLIIDTCASGGRRNDLDTLRMGAVPLHYSDVGYTEFVEKQRYHDMLDQWFIYYKNIDAFDWDNTKNEYDFYLSTIDLAPFMTLTVRVCNYESPNNRGYVDRFTAVRDMLINGDYYLLRGSFTADSWTAAQYHDPELDEGFLRVIRNPENNEDSVTLPMKGLNPEMVYEIENLDTGEKCKETGQVLLTEGITLSQEKRSGHIIRYRSK